MGELDDVQRRESGYQVELKLGRSPRVVGNGRDLFLEERSDTRDDVLLLAGQQALKVVEVTGQWFECHSWVSLKD